MIRDDYSNFKFFQCFEPQQVLDADLTGVDIDTQGYESLTICVNIGNLSIITSTSYVGFILQHTDASALGAGPSTYALVSATDLIGLDSTITALTSGIWRTIGADATAVMSALGSRTVQIGYRGYKRYVRLVVDTNSTVTTGSEPIGAIALLGYPANWPVNLDEDLDFVG
jgi:hypothetical protein